MTELLQLLTPGGQRVSAATGGEAAIEAHIADVTPADLRGLYEDMVVVRRIDEEATALQRQGELGLWASLRGQEAAQVGSGRALAPDDMAFPSYREHGVAWCRGVDPAAVLGLFRGVSHGGWDPVQHGFALYAIVVGSQTLHATGYAMGVSRDGGRCATIAYLGDGATSQGDVSEAFGWASVFTAPVVFFCQNNQYAISEPTSKQSRVPIYQRARGYGFPGVRVDGNDVLATLAVTRWALARSRAGDGPVLIEAVTYRMGAHTTADDPGRYRPAAELAAWAGRDPISRLRTHLHDTGALDDAGAAEITARADQIAARLRERCLTMTDPTPASMFDHVTVDESPPLAAQRADFLDYLGAEAGAEAEDEAEGDADDNPERDLDADPAALRAEDPDLAPHGTQPHGAQPHGAQPHGAQLAEVTAPRTAASGPRTPRPPEASCPR